jgi:hypothetical protein
MLADAPELPAPGPAQPGSEVGGAPMQVGHPGGARQTFRSRAPTSCRCRGPTCLPHVSPRARREPPRACPMQGMSPHLCPLTLRLRPEAAEAEFSATQGPVSADLDRIALPVAAVAIFCLAMTSHSALLDDGDARWRQLASIAAMASLSLVTRAWLGRAPASYIRWRDAHMAAQRALRAAFLLVRSAQGAGRLPFAARAVSNWPSSLTTWPACPRHAHQMDPTQGYCATRTPSSWQRFILQKWAAGTSPAAVDTPTALAAAIASVYSIWVRVSLLRPLLPSARNLERRARRAAFSPV